jgi:SnoaL-like domain
MAAQTDRELLISAYANFNARALDGALECMHPDVDWPNGMEGGRVHGHDGVREYWTRQWSLIDPHVEPVSFRTEEPGKTTVRVHQVVHSLKGEVLLDQMVEHTYRIEGGLIRRMDIGGEAETSE